MENRTAMLREWKNTFCTLEARLRLMQHEINQLPKDSIVRQKNQLLIDLGHAGLHTLAGHIRDEQYEQELARKTG